MMASKVSRFSSAYGIPGEPEENPYIDLEQDKVQSRGEWRVRNGLALDWRPYSRGRYTGAQRDAERAGRGIWKGSYVEPWLYRACIRANGNPSACSDDASAHP